MNRPNQQAVRETIRDLCRRAAEHVRHAGSLPDSSRIERHWQEVARRNDRRASEGR